MKPDKLKGHLDLLLLEILRGTPGHGYAVIAALRERTRGTFDLPEGTVYPALHRLEDQQLLVSDWSEESGRRRRVYRVTDRGLRALSEERTQWSTFVGAVEAILRPTTISVSPT
jgi:PadR family transcriptional regulator, regulatory protein PadR